MRAQPQGRASRGAAHRRALACTSCDAGLDEWEAQSAEAYGGRCTACQQLFEEGSFCPVCNKARAPATCQPLLRMQSLNPAWLTPHASSSTCLPPACSPPAGRALLAFTNPCQDLPGLKKKAVENAGCVC